MFGVQALTDELHRGNLAILDAGYRAFLAAAIAEAERQQAAVWLLPADPDECLRLAAVDYYQGVVVALRHQQTLHRPADGAKVVVLFS